jgi:peptidoglycan-N-acetylglucosamine deacetylase
VPTRSRWRLLTGSSLALAASAQLTPGVLILGQWWPRRLGQPAALPGGLARWRGPADGRDQIALTFDDGPDPRWTPKVLDVLSTYRYAATFFCLGQQARAHPDLVKEIVSRGHEVGVHGYRHRHHLLCPAGAIRRDVAQAANVLEVVTGAPPRYFRPPYGQVSGGSLATARSLQLQVVLWSAWGREWQDADPGSVAARVARRLRPGSIVLLHDSDIAAPPGTAATTIAALDRLAAVIADRQLKPVTLTGLLGPR